MPRKLLALLFCAAAALSAAVEPRPYFGDPGISPDGSEIAFISGGDIWTVPAKGGEARLLVSHPATESAPHYSPDGKYLAFTSTRTGNGDVYVLTFATGELKRLTFDDSNELVEGWSPDSSYVYFSCSARDISGMNDIYRVQRQGGTPMQVSADRYLTEYFSAAAPDGKTIAFTARGNAGSQWWRKGHSHLDESEIWVRQEGSPATYVRITDGGAKEAWPMWARDGRAIYYMSDRSGAQNVWVRPHAGTPRQITHFTDGRVVWPQISHDGRMIVFERNFDIWKLDTESGKAAKVEIARRGAPAGAGVQHLTINNQFQDLVLSPDGKKIAFITHGEVFAASAKDGGEAARLTQTPAPESQIVWAPDSRRLAYASTRNGNSQLFLYDFTKQQETQLTSTGPDYAPHFSPDGKSLSFVRDGSELRVLDVATKEDRLLAHGYFGKPPLLRDTVMVWSPDSQWLAYFDIGGKAFENVNVVPLKNGEARPVTFLANTGSGGLAWSPDGKYLLFTTNQRTEQSQLARVDLILHTPHFREDQFRDLFTQEPIRPVPGSPASTTTTPATTTSATIPPATTTTSTTPEGRPVTAAGKPHDPVKIVFDGIRDRLSLLQTGLDVNSIVISPDGKQAVLTATAAGQQNLYLYSLDELAREPRVPRQLTSTPGRKSSVHFTPDGKEIFYLDRGAVTSMTVESRVAKPLAVTAEMDVDFATEKMEVFHQAWTYTRDNFFDPKFNGVDWNAVRAEYEPLFAGCATPDEMRRLLNLMVGELNASHSGASAGGGPGGAQSSTGRLGVRFDRAVYESTGKLKITEVIPLSPAEVSGIKAGDTIEAVDGQPVTAHSNLDEMLEYKIGKRVVLKIAGKDVPVQPVNLATEKNLLYRDWVEKNREYVARISGGKLGYVHMQDMSEQALQRLALDLDAENQSRKGVVIDIRNNNGGFVNAYALDVFTRRPYLKMTERDRPEAPARFILGQRALEAPTILVTNQHSLSDAEDFTEGYRALKLGKVVGEPTAGWIIFTWNENLMDGTSYRLPHSRIRGADGTDMEMHPRPVDLEVSRPVGESYSGKDSQLDAAVKLLLSQL